MREVKFRTLVNGEWFYFDLTQNPKYWAHKLKDGIINQYTGLKDKNGREIYEGDIDCEDNGFKSVVCYLERYGAYCFVPVELYKHEDYAEQVNFHYGTDCYFDNVRPSKYSTIVGNIFENPELLEEN